jgi:hypothetical protein
MYIICYILGFSCYFEILLYLHAFGFADIRYEGVTSIYVLVFVINFLRL